MESGPPFVGVGGAPLSLGLGGLFYISFLFRLRSLFGSPITLITGGAQSTAATGERPWKSPRPPRIKKSSSL